MNTQYFAVMVPNVRSSWGGFKMTAMGIYAPRSIAAEPGKMLLAEIARRRIAEVAEQRAVTLRSCIGCGKMRPAKHECSKRSESARSGWLKRRANGLETRTYSSRMYAGAQALGRENY